MGGPHVCPQEEEAEGVRCERSRSVHRRGTENETATASSRRIRRRPLWDARLAPAEGRVTLDVGVLSWSPTWVQR